MFQVSGSIKEVHTPFYCCIPGWPVQRVVNIEVGCLHTVGGNWMGPLIRCSWRRAHTALLLWAFLVPQRCGSSKWLFWNRAQCEWTFKTFGQVLSSASPWLSPFYFHVLLTLQECCLYTIHYCIMLKTNHWKHSCYPQFVPFLERLKFSCGTMAGKMVLLLCVICFLA